MPLDANYLQPFNVPLASGGLAFKQPQQGEVSLGRTGAAKNRRPGLYMSFERVAGVRLASRFNERQRDRAGFLPHEPAAQNELANRVFLGIDLQAGLGDGASLAWPGHSANHLDSWRGAVGEGQVAALQ